MSINSEKKEIVPLVNRLLDNLSLTISSQTGSLGADLRYQIGKIRSSFLIMLADGTFADELLTCFNNIRDVNVKLSSLAVIHNRLFAEKPQGVIASAIVQLAVVLCLTTESRMIVKMEFMSRDDVVLMMKSMKDVFDTARDMAADAINSAVYQQLTYMAGALTNHLASTARPLPRMIKFTLPKNFPAMVLSNRIYYDPDRYEEIIAENKIVHPLFCPREIVGLSR